jgi:thiamine-phosphate pyrophosphorylase
MKLTEVARQLNLRYRSAHGLPRRPLPPLIFMTDPARTPDVRRAARALPAGSAIVLRHYDDPNRRALAAALAALTRTLSLRLLIAADARLAAEVGADGIHLPEAMASAARGLRWRPDWLVTTAAHSWPALINAAHAGADAALLSPVFATASHPHASPLGPWRFAMLAARAPLPVYALGGMNDRNARRLLSSEAVGIAAVAALAGGGGGPINRRG